MVTENLSASWDRLGVTPDPAAFTVLRGLLPVSPGQSQQPIAWEKGLMAVRPEQVQRRCCAPGRDCTANSRAAGGAPPAPTLPGWHHGPALLRSPRGWTKAKAELGCNLLQLFKPEMSQGDPGREEICREPGERADSHDSPPSSGHHWTSRQGRGTWFGLGFSCPSPCLAIALWDESRTLCTPHQGWPEQRQGPTSSRARLLSAWRTCRSRVGFTSQGWDGAAGSQRPQERGDCNQPYGEHAG